MFIVDEKNKNSWSKGVVIETTVDKCSNQMSQAKMKTTSRYSPPASKIAVLNLEQDSKSQIVGYIATY